MPRLPPTLPGLPVLGSLLDMRNDRIGTLMRASRLGDAAHLHFPMIDAVLLKHPDLIRHVLIEHHRRYSKQTRGYDMLREGLGNGLVTSEGSFWKRQRRIAQPAFHRRRISAFGDSMVKAALDTSARWSQLGDGHILEVSEEMMRLTLRIVGECLLSTDLTDKSDAMAGAITTLLHEMVKRITRVMVLPLSVPTPKNRQMRAALDTLDSVVNSAIAKRRLNLGQHNDLLEMLMTAEDEESGEHMSDKQLRDEVITIVLAGHETTANALTWAFYLLSRFPAVADKLRAELSGVLAEGRPATMDDLPNLPYLAAVINETMRLYPPIWMVARRATEDDVIGDYHIKAKQIVFVCPWVTHRDERYWDNPEGFRPERFLDGSLADLPKCSYLPFISGPRQCIGNNFALMEAQLILATLLSRHRLDLVAGHPVVPEPTVTLRPQYGMKMVLRQP